LKYLVFQIQQGGIAMTAGQLSLTNIQLTEGEWIPGYMGSKYVPSGGIILWDYNTTCPAGYQEITALADRFPVGAGAVAVGAGAGTFNPAGTAFVTGAGSSHNHSVPSVDSGVELALGAALDPSILLAVPFGGGIGGPQFVNPKHKHNVPGGTTGNEAAHTHPVTVTSPYYGVKFCRAI
jgi:hypothetical protein